MLEYNRIIRKKVTRISKFFGLLFPVLFIILLLTQTVSAQNTYLIKDGENITIHTTFASDPATILNEAGLALGAEDTFVTVPGNGMAEITIQRAQEITIQYGEKTLTVITYGETVESLLRQCGFHLTDADTVSVPLENTTRDGMQIRIFRTELREEVSTLPLPYLTEYCYNPALPEGAEVVLIPGSLGEMIRTESICLVDGKETTRTTLTETVTTAPVNALIAVGTKSNIPESAFADKPKVEIVKTVAGDFMIGDSIIITPDGKVLNYTKCDTFKATAYCREEVGGQITALGTPTRVGAIAVDPKVIPYGTKMFIISQDGKYVYGEAVAEDCGGAIKGNRIDLFYETMPECSRFGVRNCDVYFLG